MGRNIRILTFRVRRVPAKIRKTDLAEFLETTIDGGLGGANNIQVGSLARSPDDWNNVTKQTATLSFKVVPPRFDDENQTSWTILCPSLNDDLLFDTDFLGFTPLNSSREDHDYDCIAVSGLASHAFGSWRQRNSTASRQFMWLRDQLSEDFPKLRVLLYGYDTKLAGSQSSQDIDDLARTFVAHLRAVGRAQISAPPLVIFAHSLGGVLVKRALLYLAGSGDTEDFMLSRINLVVFFGVPNNGMKNQHLHAMVKNQPNEKLVQLLSIGNPYLKLMDDTLYGTSVYRSLRLVSVYETQASVTAELQLDGKWARTGPPELLVSRSSAISKGSRDPKDIFHINQNHSDLVKFSPDDLNYLPVKNIVIETLQIKSSLSIVSHRAPTTTSLQTHARDCLVPKGEPADTQSIDLACEASSITGTDVLGALQNAMRDTGLENSHKDSDFSMKEKRPISNDTSPQKSNNYDLIRKSLTFEEAGYRYNAIETAQTATFDWAFENQVTLIDWIRSGTKTYWIRGKPGSGKSTLMKFLHDHQYFRQAIADSGFEVPQIDLWYFFNERGTILQKSLDGLLRTILCSLIDQNPLFASLIAHVYHSKPIPQRDQWPINVLNEAFLAIMHQQQSDVRLLIFLDALDEYQGFPEIICDWIQRLVSTSEAGIGRTKIKICFSSRPWDSFLHAFDDSPGFALHLHTVQDIKYYTRQKLADTVKEQPTTEFSILVAQSSRLVDQIVVTIAQRAEGVFLWVTFALGEITATLKSQNSHSLESIVSCLPAQLEEFYSRTVMRIARGSRWRAFVMLELVLRSVSLVTAKDLFFASSCADGSTHTECLQMIRKAQEQNLSDLDISRNMLNLCNGLLEVVEGCPEDGLAAKYVQFIHRTTKDFVMSPNFKKVILGTEQTATPMNGYTFWLKFEFVKETQIDLNDRCSWYAHMDEKSNGRPLDIFINSVPTESLEFGDASTPKFPFSCSSSFIFGVIADLRLYVQDLIDEQQQIGQCSRLRDQNPQHALAWSAVEKLVFPEFYGTSESYLFDRSPMSAILLKNGFNIHEKAGGLTPFDILFSRAFESFGGYGGIRGPVASIEMVLLAKTFIEQGDQNPDVMIRHLDRKHDEKLHKYRFSPQTLKEMPALHVASHETMRMLLECGANPNILDGRGNTPLDTYVGAEGYFSESVHCWRLGLVYPNIKLLLDHGGLLTKRGAKVLPKFLKYMEKSGYHDYFVKKFSELPLLDVETGVVDKRRRGLLSLSTLKPKMKALMKKPEKR